DQENSLKRRAGWPVALLSSSAAASSSAISVASRLFFARPNRKSTPLASHQLIRASRANPESARSTRRTSGQRARIWATMRAVPGDPMIAGRLYAAPLEPVECALAGQRRTILATGRQLAGQHRHGRVVAQLVVVDQVFVAQRQREDPLTDQGFDGVLDQLRRA